MVNRMRVCGRYFALLSSVSLSIFPSAVFADVLPTGGQVVQGTGSISQSGSAMTVQQDTANMAINWQSFSIGQNHSVTFNQPSANSVALNRVLGNERSLIEGALNANGKVFLINPNGVLFSPSAQVNVGGIVASTLDLKSQDFENGVYEFEGLSSNAVINQGNIHTANGGTVALIAAKISNTGTITAQEGNVLMGAGSKVRLDMGGPVKLEIEKGALQSQIDQGGAIHASGGQVLLTAKAADELTTSVINHTGITEAQTLATGKNGEILLLGDMKTGTLNVGGTLDASAPVSGDGGFVETSAAHVKVADGTNVTTKAENGTNGEWLIDPNDYTIAASGGDITGATLSSNLAGGNITVSTTGAGGDLYVNDAVAWAANKLTLHANDDILINDDLVATGTGSLAFEYGQDSVDGSGGTYTVANGVQVLIPSSSNFTWKKGSTGAVNNLWFGNSYIEFSSTKAAAITSNGTLVQPFYYDDGSSGRAVGWYKLTYSSYPLDIALGTGGDGTNSWNANGQILSTSGATNISGSINSLSINIAGYNEGIGTLTSTLNINVSETSSTADIINAYSLGATDNFIKTTTTVKNNSLTTPLTNVRLWVGTRDDWVGQSDSNYKTKGNLSGSFVQITNQTDQAKAIKVTEQTDGTGAAILFYSTSSGADTVTDSCCNFYNVVGKDPHASATQTGREDGSYALFLRMNNLAAGASGNLVWYYAAGQASHIDEVIEDVSVDAGVSTPTPTPEPAPTTTPQENAVKTAQGTTTPPQSIWNAPQSASNPLSGVGSLEIVEVRSGQGGQNGNGQESGEGEGSGNGYSQFASSGGQQAGPTRIFVVDGGIKMPSGSSGNDDDRR